jgi:hypothetical protein
MAEEHLPREATSRFGDRVDDYGSARFERSQWLDFVALRELFENCAEHGAVSFDYDTRSFAGQRV